MSAGLSRLAGRLERHWFAPASTRDLGIVRAVLFFGIFYFMERLHPLVLQMTGAEDALFAPLPVLKVLFLPLGWGARPSAELVAVASSIGLAAALFATVGLWSRVSTVLATLGMALQVAYMYSFGDQHHPEALLLLAAAAVAAGPSGTAFSVDAWLRSRRGLPPAPEFSPDARWPLRIGQWLFVICYLSAGLSKLVHGGIAWMNGYTLAYYFMQDGVRWDIPLGLALADQIWLARLLSIAAVGFELSFVLAVLQPRIAWVYVLTGIAMHVTVYLTQHAPFFQWLYVYIVFIEALRRYGPLAWLARLRGYPGAPRAMEPLTG